MWLVLNADQQICVCKEWIDFCVGGEYSGSSKYACLLVTRSHLLLLYIGDFARPGNKQMSIEEEHEEKM